MILATNIDIIYVCASIVSHRFELFPIASSDHSSVNFVAMLMRENRISDASVIKVETKLVIIFCLHHSQSMNYFLTLFVSYVTPNFVV